MLLDYERAGKVIEVRSYQTVHGVWHYFTVNDGQIHLESQNYLMIVTLEGYIKIRDYFGADAVVPVYIEVEDNIRLRRRTSDRAKICGDVQKVFGGYERLF